MICLKIPRAKSLRHFFRNPTKNFNKTVEIEKICDKICIIQRGKLVGVYDLKEMANQGISLEQLYMQHVLQVGYNTEVNL
jgi:ABC-type Na+ transport system ATPase subunit NatA